MEFREVKNGQYFKIQGGVTMRKVGENKALLISRYYDDELGYMPSDKWVYGVKDTKDW
jgi:hydrogenase maturation factor